MSTQPDNDPSDSKPPKKSNPKEGAEKSEMKPSSDPPDQERPVGELSPEEQLARYEESLKNDDWGHQPC